MLSYTQSETIILSVYFYAFITGAIRCRVIEKSLKILCKLFFITLIVEILAYYTAIKYRNNMPVYGAFGVLQFFLIALYFNYSVDYFKEKNIGIYVGAIGSSLGLVNYFFVQKPYAFNTYFLLAESIIVVAMSLIAFYNMLQSDNDMRLRNNPHFWFTAIFLFFWTATFLFWGLYDFLIEQIKVNAGLLHLSLILINVITYIGFGTVFLLYPKMKTANEQ